MIAAAVSAVLGMVAGAAVLSGAAFAMETHTAPEKTIRVMTWNACGNNPGCKFYDNPTGLVGTVVWHMQNHGAYADAAIIQEFCRSQAVTLEARLEAAYGYGWDVRFAPIKVKKTDTPETSPNKQCVQGRGDYGIAIAVPDENTWWEPRYLPSPTNAEWRVAMCATVDSWWVKICNAHLSYNGDDPDYGFRTQQVAAYKSFVSPSRFRVIFGGDFNLQPPAVVGYAGGGMTPIYDEFVECAQADQSSPRTGPGTFYTTKPHDNSHMVKFDYLFADPPLPHTCGRVGGGPVESSDHMPIWMTVDMPAHVTGTVTRSASGGCLLLNGYWLLDGPSDVIHEGARVTVTGRVESGDHSGCQQGTALRVETAEPA
ncbi:endonuclease/exonuclease/phosphatase family protein [Melissospora conviva]|uniref:endonuclease/exonuclease/phosphatase family protein n=1 Tax=Melissospora conviva TaxID=3388432 RepID=UPI003B7F3393